MADTNCGTLTVEAPFSNSDVYVSACDLRFGTSPEADESWTGGVLVANDGPERATVEVGTYADGQRLGVTDTTINANSQSDVSVPTFDRAEQLADLVGVSLGESFTFGYAVESVNGTSVSRSPTNCGSVVVRPPGLEEGDVDVSGCSITREQVAPGETTQVGATVENTSSDASGPILVELVIGGTVEAVREITLGPGESQREPFTVAAEAFSTEGTDVSIRAAPGTKN